MCQLGRRVWYVFVLSAHVHAYQPVSFVAPFVVELHAPASVIFNSALRRSLLFIGL